ncbi:MAG: DotA/TraY family protein [Rhodospirillales bacterium]|nr:DotA/TraY family protein [Rhodospirillales bacterium]
MLALVYRSARLLPAGHPMLNPANIGRFGVRDVIATAANGLVVKRENIDQILIFGAVLVAMAMIVLQTILIVLYAAFGSAAHAAGTPSGTFFSTPNPNTDIIFEFLRSVFGVSDIFGSGTTTVLQPGFHAILGFYSTAMMIIAVIVVLYYVITVVGESAQTGQPFGKRFNGLWAPIRLVLALGLLVPLGDGLNAGQYMTMYIAKFGSGLATNAWIKYTESFTAPTPVAGNFAAPSALDLGTSIFSFQACSAAYNRAGHWNSPTDVFPASGTDVVTILVDNGKTSQLATFTDADIKFGRDAGAAKITYVWSAVDLPLPSGKGPSPANSTCGSIEMSIKGDTGSSDATNTDMTNAANTVQQAQVTYLTAMKQMADAFKDPSTKISEKTVPWAPSGTDYSAASNVQASALAQQVANAINAAQTSMNSVPANIRTAMMSATTQVTSMQNDAKTRGWGTAGIYYIQTARMTQAVLDAVSNAVPAPVTGPDGKSKPSVLVSHWDDSLQLPGVGGPTNTDQDAAARTALANAEVVISKVPSYITTQPTNALGAAPAYNQDFSSRGASITDPILWLARWQFGDGFLELVDNKSAASATTSGNDPMSRLIDAGGSILSHAGSMIKYYIAAKAGSNFIDRFFGAIPGAGKLVKALNFIGAILDAVAPVLWFIITVGLAVGIVLFYLLPMMPFMYFFFSAVNWVIEVAEAVVSMPLFALSHLRIDGEGLPGQTAFANWLTLFGVLLRPLLIIMGLIVGTLVFNAGVNFLAATFKYAIFAYNPDATCTLPGTGNAPCGLDIRNVSGFGIITYTVLFVYLVYMLANSCFKLIDAIPDKMLRWLGGGSSFTGDRPVDIGNMQGMALAGYAVMTQGHSALEGTEKNFRATNARRRDIKEKENEIRRLHGDVNAPSSGGMT